ncbi:hypothetical protein NKW43_15050 [Gluconobacter albidus]|uniref:hypothetical protein n=1 Tax=Gluconobacter albidus TaxID=318683 RepID=UPI0020A1E517|nr:hypothetical protein [Gluconobacter albidus]MCP1274979.1 hypothetical protein [Gluconobacter albidus]
MSVLRSIILNTFKARQLTRTMKDVLLILAERKIPASYELIAKAAGCSRSAVAYTIKHACELGILERIKTRVKRSGRWVNGRNEYRIIKRALAEKLGFPWVSSKSKICTTRNQESKKQREKHHSVEQWLAILAGMESGLSPTQAGYHAIE